MKTTQLSIALAFLLVMQPLRAAEPNADAIVSTKLGKATEQVLQPYLKTQWFSGNIAIQQGGDLLYNESFGFADLPNKIKNTPQTKIRIGSINKHFTAVLILQKIQSGQLSPTDTLAEFDLGFAEPISRKITLAHLLQHRSGFADIFNDEYIKNYRSLKDINAKLPLLMHQPLIAEPGTEYQYSNYGYIVLGAILEKLEQKPFQQILQQNILTPIGAKHTEYALTEHVQGKARSYRYLEDGSKVDKTDMLENVTPDGGMYSTPSDIILFYSKLFYSNLLLNDELKAFMGNGYKQSARTWKEILNSDKAHWNSYGGGPGVSAAVEILLKDKLITVVLANTDGLVAEKISQQIISQYRELKS